MSRTSKLIGTSVLALVEILKTDTDLGLTFASIASAASQGSKTRLRNQANARKAYDNVSRLSGATRLSETERRQLAEGLSRLKSKLEALGERFSDR